MGKGQCLHRFFFFFCKPRNKKSLQILGQLEAAIATVVDVVSKQDKKEGKNTKQRFQEGSQSRWAFFSSGVIRKHTSIWQVPSCSLVAAKITPPFGTTGSVWSELGAAEYGRSQ